MVSRLGVCSSIKEDLHRLPLVTKNGKTRVNGPLRRRRVHTVLLDAVESFGICPLPRYLLLGQGASALTATSRHKTAKGCADELLRLCCFHNVLPREVESIHHGLSPRCLRVGQGEPASTAVSHKTLRRYYDGPLRRRRVHTVLLDAVESFRLCSSPRCLLLGQGASASKATVCHETAKGYANEPLRIYPRHRMPPDRVASIRRGLSPRHPRHGQGESTSTTFIFTKWRRIRRRTFAISAFPRNAARCSGVHPSVSFASTSAPRSRRTCVDDHLYETASIDEPSRFRHFHEMLPTEVESIHYHPLPRRLLHGQGEPASTGIHHETAMRRADKPLWLSYVLAALSDAAACFCGNLSPRYLRRGQGEPTRRLASFRNGGGYVAEPLRVRRFR